jgi:hypothetical protein
VQADICEYCNTFFQDGFVWRDTDLTITRGTTGSAADKITDDDGYFVKKGFLAGMDVAIEGGYSNVGVHTIATVDASTMTLTSTAELITQDPDATDRNTIGAIKVSRVKWPKDVKVQAAQMVWWLIKRAQDGDVQSESIDDYSVTYAGSHAYPTRVVKGLEKHKRPVYI